MEQRPPLIPREIFLRTIGRVSLLLAGVLAAWLSNSLTQAATIGAVALELVNSRSTDYGDFQHLDQPYLDNFGVPYTLQDISTNAPGTNLSRYALIIIGHKQLDLTTNYLTAQVQA